jgi:hypothetical protein
MHAFGKRAAAPEILHAESVHSSSVAAVDQMVADYEVEWWNASWCGLVAAGP